MSIKKYTSNKLSLDRQGMGWLGGFLFSFTANATALRVIRYLLAIVGCLMIIRAMDIALVLIK